MYCQVWIWPAASLKLFIEQFRRAKIRQHITCVHPGSLVWSVFFSPPLSKLIWIDNLLGIWHICYCLHVSLINKIRTRFFIWILFFFKIKIHIAHLNNLQFLSTVIANYIAQLTKRRIAGQFKIQFPVQKNGNDLSMIYRIIAFFKCTALASEVWGE